MMTDEIQSAAQADNSANAVAASPSVSDQIAIPQVGDVTPNGVIFGVRRFDVGGCEISFNGVDWQSV